MTRALPPAWLSLELNRCLSFSRANWRSGEGSLLPDVMDRKLEGFSMRHDKAKPWSRSSGNLLSTLYNLHARISMSLDYSIEDFQSPYWV